MQKIDCIHYKGLCEILFNRKYKGLCEFLFEENKDTSCEGCPLYLDKNKIIELPIKATDKLKEELTKYCYERCIDEL